MQCWITLIMKSHLITLMCIYFLTLVGHSKEKFYLDVKYILATSVWWGQNTYQQECFHLDEQWDKKLLHKISQNDNHSGKCPETQVVSICKWWIYIYQLMEKIKGMLKFKKFIMRREITFNSYWYCRSLQNFLQDITYYCYCYCYYCYYYYCFAVKAISGIPKDLQKRFSEVYHNKCWHLSIETVENNKH